MSIIIIYTNIYDTAIACSRAHQMSSLLVKTAIRGYHVYRVVREPRVRESLVVLHESGNDNDRHAMAVYRDDPGVIVEHLPCEISKTCHYFTRHEGKISGEVCWLVPP